MTSLTHPRLWHPTLPVPGGTHLPRALVGRQGIFTASGDIAGHELLYRATGLEGARVDLWPRRLQDRATEHVIAAAFWRHPDITTPHPAFINVTRSYLLDHPGTMHCDPSRVIIEVLESAIADAALVARVKELAALGFRIALDDWTGTASQHALLPYADYVKIDFRDLLRLGPGLTTAPLRHGAILIAERVEDDAMLNLCIDLGFTLFQGYRFAHVEVIDRGEPVVDAPGS